MNESSPVVQSLERMITEIEAARLPVFEDIQRLNQAKEHILAKLENLDDRHNALSRIIAELRTQKRQIENVDIQGIGMNQKEIDVVTATDDLGSIVQRTLKSVRRADDTLAISRADMLGPPSTERGLHLIGISGKAGHGKDSIAEILKKRCYHRFAFADRLKRMALALDPLIDVDHADSTFCGVPRRLASLLCEAAGNWDYIKKEYREVREFLQILGTEGVRENIGDTAWIDALHRDRLTIEGRHCITDVRFPDEAEYIRKCGGEIWRVVRPGVEAVNNHASEDLAFNWDRLIINSGTLADLEVAVLAALEERR